MRGITKFLTISVISAIAILMVLPQMALARNVWRECGIGGMLFPETGWAAITSNITWDLGTTATSSNISSDSLCEGAEASTAKFVHETYTNLEEEVAMGRGKHLTALLTMLGCSDQTDRDQTNRDQMAMIVEGLRTDLSREMKMTDYAARTRLQKAEWFFNSAILHTKAGKCYSI